MAEADLLREARQGREQAFLAIYRQHRSRLFRFAWRLTGSQTAAEDVTQECFLALMRGSAFDGDRGRLRTYLFGIARNLVLRSFRISEREAEAADAAAPVDVLDDVLEAERANLVASAMAQLIKRECRQTHVQEAKTQQVFGHPPRVGLSAHVSARTHLFGSNQSTVSADCNPTTSG